MKLITTRYLVGELFRSRLATAVALLAGLLACLPAAAQTELAISGAVYDWDTSDGVFKPGGASAGVLTGSSVVATGVDGSNALSINFTQSGTITGNFAQPRVGTFDFARLGFSDTNPLTISAVENLTISFDVNLPENMSLNHIDLSYQGANGTGITFPQRQLVMDVDTFFTGDDPFSSNTFQSISFSPGVNATATEISDFVTAFNSGAGTQFDILFDTHGAPGPFPTPSSVVVDNLSVTSPLPFVPAPIIRLDANTRDYTYGTFNDGSDPGPDNVIDNGDGSISLINILTPSMGDTAFGGTALFLGGPSAEGRGEVVDFDPADYQLEVSVKTVAGNTATGFSVILEDIDDASLETADDRERFLYSVDLSQANDTEFTTLTFDLLNDFAGIANSTGAGGDGILNPGLKQLILQSFSDDTVLNVDIESISIIEKLVADGLAGDYNDNGVVDAADYTLWRDALGTDTELANRDAGQTGNVSQGDYDVWKANFGNASPTAVAAASAVPEPTSLVLLLSMALSIAAIKRQSRN